MRIRSVRPEFWSSTDIAALPWDTRLVFLGLWNYVDDNAVGRDVAKLIVADLFPLDDDTHGVLMKVTGALKQLETGGQITRYVVDGKPYLHVTNFLRHQVINRPSRGRYPLPTCENAEPNTSFTEYSVSPPADAPIGEGEKGRRGEVKTPSSAAADGAFDTFWKLYPRKVGKQDAHKAWTRALKATDTETILAGLKFYLPTYAVTAEKFIPHPSKWLNDGRWDDEVTTPEPNNQPPSPWDYTPEVVLP